MEIKYKSNLAAGIVSIILGVICIILVPLQIAEDYSATYGITSRTIPCAIGVLWIVCGVVLLIQSLILKKDTVKTLIVGKELKALAYMAMLLIYSILFKRSFLISTILLGVATLAMTGTKKKLYYVIVIAMVVVLYLCKSIAYSIAIVTGGVYGTGYIRGIDESFISAEFNIC